MRVAPGPGERDEVEIDRIDIDRYPAVAWDVDLDAWRRRVKIGSGEELQLQHQITDQCGRHHWLQIVWVVDSETPAGLAGQTLHQMFCGELHRHAKAANSRWSRPKMSEEARWPITLGGLYYGVLPKASHGELCPSPFVVIDLEPAPTQRAGIYQRAVSGFPARHRSGGRYHTTTGRLHLTPLPKQTNNTAPTTPLRTSDDSKQIDPGRFRTSPSSTEV